ncbi:MAG: hypothetical protein AAGK97_15155 [Bacteroidota bacterium]
MKNKGIIITFGFLLFLFGFLALILSMIGVQLTFLRWIDSPGKLFGLIIRIVMILSGIVMMYIARVNPNE